MSEKLIENVREFEKADISDITKDWEYKTKDFERENKYKIMLGDSTERLKEVDSDSVGLSVFSPPFMSLYTYSPTERDLGNSKTQDEFFEHFNFIIEELLRITMPGRNCAVHVANIASTLSHDGFIGLKDFRGDVIRAFQKGGWIYHGEVTIDKNPQVQAIRTHAKGLLFVQKDKDSSWLRPALADYIVIFRKPGENPEPIKGEISNEEWIEFARPVWYGIKETDVLNASIARENKDERHICPLQLGTIERCIKLWSNPNDIVLSPFMGIGSEGFKALQLGRRFIGIELKESYFNIAKRNLEEALAEKLTLF
jgi:DNA modification methylase